MNSLLGYPQTSIYGADTMTGFQALILDKFCDSDSNEAQRDMDLILELNNLMSRFFDLNRLFPKALSRVINHFNFDAGRIYLINNKSNHLELVASQGIEKKGLEKIHVAEGLRGKPLEQIHSFCNK